jgi:hypothetical protein
VGAREEVVEFSQTTKKQTFHQAPQKEIATLFNLEEAVWKYIAVSSFQQQKCSFLHPIFALKFTRHVQRLVLYSYAESTFPDYVFFETYYACLVTDLHLISKIYKAFYLTMSLSLISYCLIYSRLIILLV